jgi:hypothetical protein
MFKPTPKTPANLDEAKAQLDQSRQEAARQAADAAQRQSERRAEPFTDAQLAAAWEAFRQHPAIQDSPLLATIHQTSTYERAQSNISLYLANSLQEAQLPKMMPQLLKHLREALRNDDIEIQASVRAQDAEAGGPKRIYTDQDRLEFLEQQYPNLRLLREKLGLSIN